MVKKKDLSNMNKAELEKNLKDLRMELVKANAQVSSGTAPKSPGQIRYTKKTIARILTLIKNKTEDRKKHE